MTKRILLQMWFYMEPTEENYEALKDALEKAVDAHQMTQTDMDFILRKAKEELE